MPWQRCNRRRNHFLSLLPVSNLVRTLISSTHHQGYRCNNYSLHRIKSKIRNKTFKKWRKVRRKQILLTNRSCNFWPVRMNKLNMNLKEFANQLICLNNSKYSKLIMMTQQGETKRLIWLWRDWGFRLKSLRLKVFQLLMNLSFILWLEIQRKENMEKPLTFFNLKINKNLEKNFVKD